MAKTIHLLDGSVEVIFDNPVDTLRRIVRERLGDDAERIIADLQAGGDTEALEEEMRGYEGTVEDQRALLIETMESLAEVLPAIKNKDAVDRLRAICKNIYNNI